MEVKSMNKKGLALVGIALVALVAVAFAATTAAPATGQAADKTGWHHGKGWWGSQLTEAQHAQLKEQVTALKEKGADREEIHAAVQKFFEDNGLAFPEKPMNRFGHGFGFGGHGVFKGRMANLSDEQKAALKALHEEFKQKAQAIIDGK